MRSAILFSLLAMVFVSASGAAKERYMSPYSDGIDKKLAARGDKDPVVLILNSDGSEL